MLCLCQRRGSAGLASSNGQAQSSRYCHAIGGGNWCRVKGIRPDTICRTNMVFKDVLNIGKECCLTEVLRALGQAGPPDDDGSFDAGWASGISQAEDIVKELMEDPPSGE